MRQGDVLRFKMDGVLVKDAFLVGAAFKALVRAVEKIAEWPETPGKHMVYRKHHRVENFYPYHVGIRAILDGPVCKAVSELFGEPAVLFKDKLNLKPPGGKGFTAHQDQRTYTEYGGHFIAAAIAIDECTQENGCLEVAYSRHLEGLFGPTWDTLPNEADFDFEPIGLNPGDVLFLDSYTPHRSKPNNSDKPRRVLYATFNPISDGDWRERHFSDKRMAYPPDIEREPGKTYLTGAERRGYRGMQT